MLVVGNWKMNGSIASLSELSAIDDCSRSVDGVDVALAPPFTLLAAAAERSTYVMIVGQDCHEERAGAHTGSVSAAMLRDAGARAVILGHSERRGAHHESDALVRAKAEAAIEQGLFVILCVGESANDEAEGRSIEVVRDQLLASLPAGGSGRTLAIAYEPIWAIGTGRTPTSKEISRMHGMIRRTVADRYRPSKVRVLYGGSVGPVNAREIGALDEVDGLLVGGASLTAAGFAAVVRSCGAAESTGSDRDLDS